MSCKKFADKLLIFLKKYKDYSKKEEDVVHYGLEIIYIFISKLIIITIFGLFFNILKEMYIFIFFYGLLRLFAGGMHLSKSFDCTIFSIIILIGLPLISLYTNINFNIRIIITGISLCIIALYSPADTIKKPMIHVSRRIKNKIKSYIVCLIYLICLLFIKNTYILNCISYAMILESLLICPFSYKIFNQSYNNYIDYCRKEGCYEDIS